MSKKLIVPIVVVLLVLGGGIFGVIQIQKWLKPSSDKTTQKNKVAEEVNVIPLADRPYVQIAPLADGHNVILIVKSLGKTAQNAEYELEYQSGTLLQGAFGSIELGTIPAQEQVLLGSCSAGGKCSYHEDVQGGKLLLRFMDKDSKYVLRTDWRYRSNVNLEPQMGSKDAKFKITGDALASQKYLVVYNSPGYPEGLTGEVVSDVYSLAVSGTLKGTGDVSVRVPTALDTDKLALMGYTGSEWKKLPSVVTDKTVIGANVELMELYTVVKE